MERVALVTSLPLDCLDKDKQTGAIQLLLFAVPRGPQSGSSMSRATSFVFLPQRKDIPALTGRERETVENGMC